MKVFVVPFVALIALAMSPVSSLAESELSRNQAVYQESLEKIETGYHTRTEACGEAYARGLAGAIAKAKQSGDLEGLIALKEEEERFLEKKSVPAKPPARVDPVVGGSTEPGKGDADG